MDRDGVVAFMQQKLGFRTQLTSACITALQIMQDQLERGATLPWWLLQEDTVFPITPAVPASSIPQQYNLPTGFIKEPDHQDGNLRLQLTAPGPQIFIEKMDYEQAEKFFFGLRQTWWDGTSIIVQQTGTAPSPGKPKAYVLRATKVRIYPGPDVAYNLLWTYYAHDVALTGSNVTNGWTANAPLLLAGRAGVLVSQDIRDADAASAFQAVLAGNPQLGMTGAEKEYLATLYERELGGRTYSMGARL